MLKSAPKIQFGSQREDKSESSCQKYLLSEDELVSYTLVIQLPLWSLPLLPIAYNLNYPKKSSMVGELSVQRIISPSPD